MILAKRLLNAVGYIFYDHYNGRYIRNVYTKRMQHMQEFEVIASARSMGRFLLQLFAMSIVGRTVAWAVMKSSQGQRPPILLPCLLQPSWVCDWWSGMVWMGSVCLTGWGVSTLIARDGFVFKRFVVGVQNSSSSSGSTTDDKEEKSGYKFYRNPLSIRPTVMGTSATNPRRWRRNAKSPILDKIRQIPWQLLQYMKDPEESINNMFRVADHKSHYPFRSPPKATTPNLDTFLFPSTWTPLRIWSCLVVVQAVFETLSRTTIPWDRNKSSRLRVMKAFLLQETIHNEWYRVFVKERRVALGAIISLIELLALLRMVVVVTLVDRLAGLALIPVLIAVIVTWYMNTILYFDHYLPSARPASKKKRTLSMLSIRWQTSP
ncbi:MAG: hypothetical protein SGILL_007300 [Bacillariaceae sp.]